MLPKEITEFVGRTGDVTIMEVEKGAIKRFADAVGDRNPLYWDEEYARNSRYGSIIAPPGFFGWPTTWTGAMPGLARWREQVRATILGSGYSRALDAGIEYEFFRPVRAGDTLAALETIADISEREGKQGKMVLQTTETTYTSQRGDLVAKARVMLIYR